MKLFQRRGAFIWLLMLIITMPTACKESLNTDARPTTVQSAEDSDAIDERGNEQEKKSGASLIEGAGSSSPGLGTAFVQASLIEDESVYLTVGINGR